jgi:uncharacterized protein YjiS (DUF1127 family)
MTIETNSLNAIADVAEQRAAVGLASVLIRRFRRRRAYTDLLELDDHLLRDIGLTRADLRAKILPPWRARG